MRAFAAASGRAVRYRVAARGPGAGGHRAQCHADASLALQTLGWRAELDIDSMRADAWRWQCWAAENLSRYTTLV